MTSWILESLSSGLDWTSGELWPKLWACLVSQRRKTRPQKVANKQAGWRSNCSNGDFFYLIYSVLFTVNASSYWWRGCRIVSQQQKFIHLYHSFSLGYGLSTDGNRRHRYVGCEDEIGLSAATLLDLLPCIGRTTFLLWRNLVPLNCTPYFLSLDYHLFSTVRV